MTWVIYDFSQGRKTTPFMSVILQAHAVIGLPHTFLLYMHFYSHMMCVMLDLLVQAYNTGIQTSQPHINQH